MKESMGCSFFAYPSEAVLRRLEQNRITSATPPWDLCVALTGPFCTDEDEGDFCIVAIVERNEGIEAAEQHVLQDLQDAGLSLESDDKIWQGVIRLHFSPRCEQIALPNGIEEDEALSNILVSGIFGVLSILCPDIQVDGISISGHGWFAYFELDNEPGFRQPLLN